MESNQFLPGDLLEVDRERLTPPVLWANLIDEKAIGESFSRDALVLVLSVSCGVSDVYVLVLVSGRVGYVLVSKLSRAT